MTEHRSPVGRVMGALVPTVVDAVDPDALIDRLDIDALMERVDVDALITRVDLDALLTRIDLDALLGRIDLDALLARIDVGALIARMDMNEVIGQVDMNAVIGQVDLNALLDDVDIKAVVAKAGIDEIVAEASTGVITRTLDLARRQLVGIDIIIMGAVDRIFRRQRPALPDTPKLSATGRSAGPVSRTIAFGFDLFFVSVLFGMVAYLGRSLVELFTGDIVHPTRGAGIAWTVGYFTWFGLYLWGSIEIAGRTPGKALVGLRVADLEGKPLGPGRALVRTLAFPFSFILGLGFIPAVTRRDRRALHELVAGSKEIVDWGDREAGIPSALEGWVGRQRDAQVIALTAAAAAASTSDPEVVEIALDPAPEAVEAEPVAEAEAEADEADPVAALSSIPVLVEEVDQGALEPPTDGDGDGA
ncbi:MAG TPA: RDD family protein, partial [Acidimicrobiales bacterium]|nr:RDD family protein [Acidimicrobiales bacterium]